MNSYLEPLVDDLLVLWEGISIAPTSCAFPIVVRGALLAVSCDVTATRWILWTFRYFRMFEMLKNISLSFIWWKTGLFQI